MLYDNKHLNDIEYQIYNTYVANDPILPDVYVYLRTSPQFCFKNIQTRSRKGEHQISLEYLQQCDAAHKSWILELDADKTTPVYVIDVNEHTPPIETAKMIANILYKYMCDHN